MQTLLILDEKNYTDSMPVYEKYTVRGIIRRGDCYAMQKSRAGEYKIPGGGVEQGETLAEALCREVREETGLLVDASTIRGLGEILEVREDLHCRGQKYICHSLYYSCDVFPETVPLEMTESEQREGFRLAWATLDEIISANTALQKEEWKKRDTRFLKLLSEGKIVIK
ncbi:MAG: NUDIX hydrolase [Roseburia sp.]